MSWYVNFERPLQRTAQGFDTMDEILGLVVARDFSEWTRKDTDELDLAVRMGFFRPVDAARIDSPAVPSSRTSRGVTSRGLTNGRRGVRASRRLKASLCSDIPRWCEKGPVILSRCRCDFVRIG